MFVLNQPDRPIIRVLKPGARIVFMSVWPVLKSLPADGHAPFLRDRLQRAEVGREVGCAVRIGHALHDRGVGVELGSGRCRGGPPPWPFSKASSDSCTELGRT